MRAAISDLLPGGRRLPAVAGRFYPADPGELRQQIESMLLEARKNTTAAPPGAPAGQLSVKAIIAPHAGYVFSGPIAASAFSCLAPERSTIKRVVLLGPSHFVAFPGLAASSADSFATPLGAIRVDREAVQQLIATGRATVLDQAHAGEHSLEVELPFLQVVLQDFAIVPLVAGDATPGQVAAVIETLWGGPETRFVISSDLSHYLNSDAARLIDAATAAAIERLAPEDITEGQACGRIPILGLLEAAHHRGLRARALDLRNSGDTAGPRHQVVGYGGFAFSPVS